MSFFFLVKMLKKSAKKKILVGHEKGGETAGFFPYGLVPGYIQKPDDVHHSFVRCSNDVVVNFKTFFFTIS